MFQTLVTQQNVDLSVECEAASGRYEAQLAALNENLGSLRAEWSEAEERSRTLQQANEELLAERLGEHWARHGSWVRASRGWVRASRGWVRASRGWMRVRRGWVRASRGWVRASRGWVRASRGWVRASRGCVRARRCWVRASRGCVTAAGAG